MIISYWRTKVCDTLTDESPYKKSFSYEEALGIMIEGRVKKTT